MGLINTISTATATMVTSLISPSQAPPEAHGEDNEQQVLPSHSRDNPRNEDIRIKRNEQRSEIGRSSRRNGGQSALRSDIERLKVELEVRSAENTELRAQVKRLQARGAEDERKIANYKRTYKDTSDTMRLLKEEKQSLSSHILSLERQVAEAQRQEEEHKATLAELANVKRKADDLSTLLDTRTAELKGAQSFLTTADAVSGTDVIDAIRRFNNEFMQISASIAESSMELFQFAPFRGMFVSKEHHSAVESVTGMMGPKLAELLLTKNHQHEPILVQIIFQSYFAIVFHWLVSSWAAGDGGTDSVLKPLWEKMRSSEVQAVSGKWRALTQASLPPINGDRTVERIVDTLLDGLTSILLAAKCTTPASDIRLSLRDKYVSQFVIMAKMAGSIRKNIREDVTSSDFEIVIIRSGCAFIPEEMEDAYRDGKAPRNGRYSNVLCPTDLGLLQHTKRTRGEEVSWDTKLLLRPKVALESVVEAIDG